jgi:hypothetical protein
MKLSVNRPALLVLSLAAALPACGSSNERKRIQSDEAGAGTGGASGNGGSKSNGGTSGSGGSRSNGGSSGNGGSTSSGGASGGSGGTAGGGAAGNSNGSGGNAREAGAPDASLDGSSGNGGSDSGSACNPGCAAHEACVDGICVEADIDAGTDCVGSPAGAPLSATALGLPSDGLKLWVRGDRGVYKTATGAVCAWRDQSGNGRVLLPGGVRPTWEGDSVGTLPAIHFKTTSDQLGVGDVLGIGAASARTFIAVDALVKDDGRFHPILQGQGNTDATYVGIDANTWSSAGKLEGAYLGGSSYDSTTPTTTSPRLHVLVLSTMAENAPVPDSALYRVDGTTQTLNYRSGSGKILPFATANFTVVGDVSSTPSNGIHGDARVAEALIYDRALTTPEITAVETSLMARYAIKPVKPVN